jgi:hypothetical protein
MLANAGRGFYQQALCDGKQMVVRKTVSTMTNDGLTTICLLRRNGIERFVHDSKKLVNLQSATA